VADHPRRSLRENLEALLARSGMPKRTFAQKAGISANTLYLILAGEDNKTRLDVVERIAAVFKVPTWRLLRPGVLEKEPGAPSDTAMDIAATFDALPAERQARAYALIVQLLEFQNEGRREDRPLPSEAPTPAPAPAPPPPGKSLARARP
jgi:transcriptional regulator with XRE-family HTH domain